MINGTINVTAENIFPIIKKFLYSDHEIFLREIVSNAVDASIKLKTLVQIGEIDKEIDKLIIEIKIKKDKKTLHIIDYGIGMTFNEVEKYINQIAFSGAEEFVEKYKNKNNKTKGIIGHFGLGFYSVFMVADKVEIFSKSYKKEEPGIYWSCDGSPKFNLEKINNKEKNGTEIILHINDENNEFLETNRIKELLNKYCKFMPIPIKFGYKEDIKKTENNKEEKIKIDNIINDPHPIWTRKPDELKEKDYKIFYRNLYPMQIEDPLFWIHLNIDHPFYLTGILYFPKLKNQVEIQKDKIQLYQNQVFVTDNIEGIVPEFLHLLRGVIDSPDIPLNVSRSYLQTDSSVKKISGYITKKVSDKLENIFKNNRKDFEKKWEDIKIIIEYGMLSDNKFFERAKKFAIYPDTEGNYFTFEEFTEIIKFSQKDKEGKIIYLYSSNKEIQDSYIQSAKNKGYKILFLNSPLVIHLIQKLEGINKNISFVRIDSDSIEKLIKKDEVITNNLSDIEKEKIKKLIEKTIDDKKFNLILENRNSNEIPFIITIPEFMRRMKEMNQMGANIFNSNKSLDSYNLIVNTNHKLIKKILNEKNDEIKNKIIINSLELAMLSQNLLYGEDLSKFIIRSFEEIS